MTNMELTPNTGPSRRLLVGLGIGLAVLAVVVLLFRREARSALGSLFPLGTTVIGWLAQRPTAFINLKPETQIILVQTVFIVIGGAWVFYRFRTQRLNQPTLRILGSARLERAGAWWTMDKQWRLFVRVHIVNISSVNLAN